MYRNTQHRHYIRSYLILSLSRYNVQHACTETIDTDNIFGPLSLSHYDVKNAYTEKLNNDNIFVPLSLSLSLWRSTCMYRNTRYWQYNRDPLSLSRYDVQHACTETLDTENIFGSLSLSLWRTTCMYRNTQHRQYIRASLSLSLSLSLWRTTCMYRNPRYWHYIRATLSLSHYDVQHACTETLDTENIFGPLSPLSLSLLMTYNMHVQKHSIMTLYSGLSLSLSLWRTTCIYRITRYWQYIRGSLSLVMTYNMHVQNTRYSQYIRASLSLSCYDVRHTWTETRDTDNIFGSLSLCLSLWRTTCM